MTDVDREMHFINEWDRNLKILPCAMNEFKCYSCGTHTHIVNNWEPFEETKLKPQNLFLRAIVVVILNLCALELATPTASVNSASVITIRPNTQTHITSWRADGERTENKNGREKTENILHQTVLDADDTVRAEAAAAAAVVGYFLSESKVITFSVYFIRRVFVCWVCVLVLCGVSYDSVHLHAKYFYVRHHTTPHSTKNAQQKWKSKLFFLQLLRRLLPRFYSLPNVLLSGWVWVCAVRVTCMSGVALTWFTFNRLALVLPLFLSLFRAPPSINETYNV